MIICKIDNSPGEYRLSVSGHAGYDEYGKDIICAGVSTLVCTAAEMIQTDRDILYRYVRIEDGESDIICIYDKTSDRLKGVTDTINTGLKMLAEQYPEYIFVKENFTGK